MKESEARTSGVAAFVEDGGKPWTMQTDRIAVENGAAFNLADTFIDLLYDPVSGQAPWSRGQVEVIADVSGLSGSSAATDWFYLEVNVIGFVGQVRTVIARFAFGPSRQQARVPLDHPWEKIGFESRQVTAGAEAGVVPNELGFVGIARMYR